MKTVLLPFRREKGKKEKGKDRREERREKRKKKEKREGRREEEVFVCNLYERSRNDGDLVSLDQDTPK